MSIIFDMAGFYRWLSEELEVDLIERRDEIAQVLLQLNEEEVILEAKRLLNLIETELLARKLR